MVVCMLAVGEMCSASTVVYSVASFVVALIALGVFLFSLRGPRLRRPGATANTPPQNPPPAIMNKSLAATPTTVDEYIAAFSPEVQSILQRVRQVARAAAPEAQEVISYRMPALKQGGILVYFAAFKNHVGLYPPVSGDSDIEKAIAPYAGEKGNLRFPFDKPIPYDLIARITALRLKQNLAKASIKRTKVKP